MPDPEQPYPQESPQTFENSLGELQRIVSQLEHGQLGLEDSMQQFERGIQLIRACSKQLESAEQRIEVLTGTRADGSPVTQPFDAAATVEDASKPKKKRTKQRKPKEPEPESETLF